MRDSDITQRNDMSSCTVITSDEESWIIWQATNTISALDLRPSAPADIFFFSKTQTCTFVTLLFLTPSCLCMENVGQKCVLHGLHVNYMWQRWMHCVGWESPDTGMNICTHIHTHTCFFFFSLSVRTFMGIIHYPDPNTRTLNPNLKITLRRNAHTGF